MAVFSTNQNRQFYLVNKVVITTPKAIGETQVCLSGDKKQAFLMYYGPAGLVRTDIMDLANVTSCEVTAAAKLSRKLKKAVITLDASVNGGNPVSGQDYVLKIAIKDYVVPSVHSTLIKYGVVRATAGMTKEAFYKALAKSLTMNFSREPIPLLKFEGAATGLTITEELQPYNRGTYAQKPVYFEIIPTTINVGNDEVFWMTRNAQGGVDLTDTATVVPNGKNIADLEYFCMGERGDQYRMIGYPDYLKTTYLVDPAKSYHVLDIHYFFADCGVYNQRSEKEMTLVSENDAVLKAIKTAIDTVRVPTAPTP